MHAIERVEKEAERQAKNVQSKEARRVFDETGQFEFPEGKMIRFCRTRESAVIYKIVNTNRIPQARGIVEVHAYYKGSSGTTFSVIRFVNINDIFPIS
jgi:hypothetical protein